MASESLDFSDRALNWIASIIMDATTYTTHSTWFVSFPIPVQGSVPQGFGLRVHYENKGICLIHRGACLDRESRTLRPVLDQCLTGLCCLRIPQPPNERT